MPYRTNAYGEPVDIRYTLTWEELRMAVADWLENNKDVDGVGAENAKMEAIVEGTSGGRIVCDISRVEVHVEVKNR